MLSFVACAGYDMPDVLIQDTNTGQKFETNKDGKICIDDGKTKSGCIKLNKKEEIK